MHKLSIWLLLALVPFTGLRMVCVDAPAAAKAEVPAKQHACERVDPRLDAPGSRLQCLLVPHPSQLVLLVVSPLAPPPVQVPLQAALVTAGPVPVDRPTLYLAPRFPPQTPPPRA